MRTLFTDTDQAVSVGPRVMVPWRSMVHWSVRVRGGASMVPPSLSWCPGDQLHPHRVSAHGAAHSRRPGDTACRRVSARVTPWGAASHGARGYGGEDGMGGGLLYMRLWRGALQALHLHVPMTCTRGREGPWGGSACTRPPTCVYTSPYLHLPVPLHVPLPARTRERTRPPTCARIRL
jgi:hypothetical protein